MSGRWQTVLRVTFVSNSWSFLVDFGRPITLLSPTNIPETHQYAVTRVAHIVAQILGVLLKQNLVDKISWYMRFFLVLPNKYYTFVTSPFLSASPSPAPVCSILGGPNRLDLWLDLCLKLLFSWTKSVEGDKRCCEWHLSRISYHFCSILGGRSPPYHQKTCPEPTNMWSHL